MRRPTYQPLLIAFLITVFPFIMTLFLAHSKTGNIGALTHGIVCILPHLIFGVCLTVGWLTRDFRVTVMSIFFGGLYTYLSLPLPFEFLELDPIYRGEMISVAVPLALMAFMGIYELTHLRKRAKLSIAFLFGIPILGSWIWQKGLINLSRDIPAEALFSGLPIPAIIFTACFGLLMMRVSLASLRGFYLFLLMALIPLDYIASRLYFGSMVFSAMQVELSAAFVIIGALLVYGIHWMKWSAHHLDSVTGLPNREAFKNEVHSERQFALALIDVDDLETIANQYGPNEAMHVLRCVAVELQRTAKRARIFRTGPRQFSLYADGKDDFEVAKVMEAARSAIEARKFVVRKEQERKQRSKKDRVEEGTDTSDLIPLSISVGVAANGNQFQTSQSRNVVGAASKALAKARAAGKNRVYVESLEPGLLQLK